MSAKFVVSHLDQQLGPFDEATLKAKWLEGEFLPIDYVFDEAKQDWVLIAERFEWAKKPAQVAPPPLKRPEVKKKTPPPAPKEAIALAATSPSINLGSISLSSISVPTLNVPMPQEPETKVSFGPGTSTQIALTHPSAEKFKMVDGIAEVDLSKLAPGAHELVVNNAGQEIKLNLQVRSAEPSKIEWTVLSLSPTVGQDLEVTCRAHDKHGHYCSDFSGAFTLKANDREYKFEIVKGNSTVKFQQTKAEKCTLTLHNQSPMALEMPTPVTVEWQPGPAVSLILDGSPDLVAGSPQKVQVKAVDQYGNLAKTFQGTLNLEVKAG